MEYLDTLNDAQRAAVMAPDGPMLVIAGAGSGKTRVLTMRIAYLLSQGVKPYNILALTFTNKAAREMKDRIGAIVGPEVAGQLWMGTFHSIFARILRIEAEALGFNSNFTIYDSQDSKSLIRQITKSMGLDDKTYKTSSVLSAISAAKNELITPQAYANNDNYQQRDAYAKRPQTTQIYARYVNECKKANALDFDDLLLYTNVLFRDHRDILAKYQNKFSHVLVDEYQDTNHSQYVIIKRLVEQTHSICVVGDDAQSIYSFRGARIENILRFSQDYPEYRLYKLEQNYRSTQNIVNAANSLISHNQNRIKKNVFSDNEEGEKVRIVEAQSDIDEATKICSDIASRIRYDANHLQDFAILYRTNAQSRPFEEAMRKANLKYKIFGGLAFYQRKEVKDLLAYLRLCVNTSDSESLKRVINYPTRGIGATTLGKIQAISDDRNIPYWDAMQMQYHKALGLNAGTSGKLQKFCDMVNVFAAQAQNLDAYQLAAEVLSQSGMMQDLMQNKNDTEGKERFDNIMEMMSGIKEFCEQRREMGDEEDAPTNIEAYLSEVALISDLDSTDSDISDHVTLMTIHSSKGLEFNNVYIVGVEDDLFPGQQSATNPLQLEEERRLFYVALTRAQKHCTVSYTLSRFKFGEREPARPSRFITELDDNFVDKPQHVGGLRFNPYTADRQQSSWAGRMEMAKPSKLQRLRTLNARPEQPKSDFAPQPTSDSINHGGKEFRVGMTVVHDTFGQGVITEINGTGSEAKLKIQFAVAGQKQLLVKFARLKPLY